MAPRSPIATRILAFLLPSLLGACAVESADEPERGTFRDGHVSGSCADPSGGDACGGPATDGNCYCDDQCERYGDCCSDYQAVCEAQACGGLLGLRCDQGEYCEYAPEAICGRADATGTCQTQPEFCTEQYDPVCGCDGQTYGNACQAAAAGVSVEFEGECAPQVRACGGLLGLQCEADEFCAFAPDAICGFADATGVCTPRPQACTLQFDPVCGCDGRTYGSACSAASAGVSVASDGVCGDSCIERCGGQAPDGCWCDDQCARFGDCCSDAATACE